MEGRRGCGRRHHPCQNGSDDNDGGGGQGETDALYLLLPFLSLIDVVYIVQDTRVGGQGSEKKWKRGKADDDHHPTLLLLYRLDDDYR